MSQRLKGQWNTTVDADGMLGMLLILEAKSK
jgi:hypothetical protein